MKQKAGNSPCHFSNMIVSMTGKEKNANLNFSSSILWDKNNKISISNISVSFLQLIRLIQCEIKSLLFFCKSDELCMLLMCSNTQHHYFGSHDTFKKMSTSLLT